MCAKLVDDGCIESPVKFFTQHNRSDIIFRADPEFQDTGPWYDWVYCQWDEGSIPARLLLFMDLPQSKFLRQFQFGTTTIFEPGKYAISHSFEHAKETPAHLISKMMMYGELMTEPDPKDKSTEKFQLTMFPCDSIEGTCSAIPYHTSKNIIDAKEWLLLRPKSAWYQIFVDYIDESL